MRHDGDMERAEIEGLLKDGLSLAAIARRKRLDPSTVRKAAKRLGIAAPEGPKYAAKRIPLVELQALVEDGATLRRLADHFGVSPATIRKHLRRHGLSTVRDKERRMQPADGGTRPRHWTRGCPRHGHTTFQLEGRGYYRCLECRAEAVVRRRRKVKEILVGEAGGACVLCGYDRCVRALHFHHPDPEAKAFALSGRGYTRGIESLRIEAGKCVLLCSNCHAEVEGGVTTLR